MNWKNTSANWKPSTSARKKPSRGANSATPRTPTMLLVGYGIVSRVLLSTVEALRKEGVKAGLFRPITLWPYPSKALAKAAREGGKSDCRRIEQRTNAGRCAPGAERQGAGGILRPSRGQRAFSCGIAAASFGAHCRCSVGPVRKDSGSKRTMKMANENVISVVDPEVKSETTSEGPASTATDTKSSTPSRRCSMTCTSASRS